jgi:hypothetical protein
MIRNKMEPIQEFSPGSENFSFISKLIRKSGIDVCKQQNDRSWIEESLSTSSFGFIYLSPKAQIGRRSIKNDLDKINVQGFITCRISKENPNSVWIDLVCSKQRSKVGLLLMEVAEERIRSIEHPQKIIVINLYSLPEEKLVNWYRKLGYGAEDLGKLGRKDLPKVFHMQKIL